MGTKNRQRRADKRRRRERRRDHGSRSGFAFLDERDIAEILTFDAAEAAEHGETERLEEVLRRLNDIGALGRTAMTGALVSSLRSAWEGGWQPQDVVRAAAKRLSAAHAELAAEMITLDARSASAARSAVPEAWAAQLQTLDRSVRRDDDRWRGMRALRDGAGLMGMLIHLPVLPSLMPTPSQWGRGRGTQHRSAPVADERVVDRVRALLAKAESTAFVEEADALTSKAQELMARFSIDHAMVAGEAGGEEPCGRRLAVDDPYAQGKANLLAAIASANRCRTVWMSGYGFSTVVGFANDVDIVEVLYVSLLVQATRAMTAAGAVRDSAGRSRTRSFRQSFMFSFARRIGERLEEAASTAVDEAAEVVGSRLLPVLAGRASEVDQAFEEMFPDLKSSQTRISSMSGWAAGRAAADLVQLGPEQQLLPGVAV